MSETGLRQALVRGAAELGLPLPKEGEEALLAYVALLERWNKAFNLTAVRDPAEMIPRHLLESLSVSAYLHGESVLDLGTGAGLPGIPLAILHPGIRFTLLDSNGKKTRFVRQAVLALGLKNVRVEQVRAERYHPPARFDTIVTRAFAALPGILDLTTHLLAPGGRLLAMKSRLVEDELRAANLTGWRAEVIPLRQPRSETERCVVLIQREAE